MRTTIREATPDDAALLLRVIDMASEGLVPALQDQMAPERMYGTAAGRPQVQARTSPAD